MEAAAPVAKLRLRYKEPAELASIDPELSLTSFFADYYEADQDTLAATIARRRVERLKLYGKQLAEPVTDTTLIEGLIGGEAIPYNESEQRIINLYSAMVWLEKQAKPLNMVMLQTAHKMLLSATPKAHLGGVLRTEGRDLFAVVDSEVQLPNAEELKTYLNDIFIVLANDSIHPLTRAFLFYYLMHSVQAFGDENNTIAILGTHYFLKQSKYSLLGLLNLEEHVFMHEKFREQMAPLFTEPNYQELLDKDLTSYLEVCINQFHAHLQEIREVIIGVVKELFGYPDFTPRQKNVLNFWLNKGFFLQHQKLHELTPRQHDIMMLLVKYGSVTNKDLVPIFQVDRKTLQRDFTTIVDLGLAEQRGMGRAVRYFVDFRIPLS